MTTKPPPRDPDDEPVLPDRATDDSDVGWGDERETSGRRDADWYRSEKPPHHGE